MLCNETSPHDNEKPEWNKKIHKILESFGFLEAANKVAESSVKFALVKTGSVMQQKESADYLCPVHVYCLRRTDRIWSCVIHSGGKRVRLSKKGTLFQILLHSTGASIRPSERRCPVEINKHIQNSPLQVFFSILKCNLAIAYSFGSFHFDFWLKAFKESFMLFWPF